MMIDHIFIDLDNTILDFYAAEAEVLAPALAAHGIVPSEETLALYQKINVEQWQLLEKGVISIDDVGVRRFALLAEALGCVIDAKALSDTYEAMLMETCHFMPGAQELLHTLQQHYRLHLVTNGMASVQYGRIHRAGIAGCFEHLFVSSDLGAVKPSQAFFDACFAQIEGFDRSRAVILGDGLGADICGGLQAGLRTIWYNAQEVVNESPWKPDVEIRHLADVPAVLMAWENET